MQRDSESMQSTDASTCYPKAVLLDDHNAGADEFGPIDADAIDESEFDPFEPIPASAIDE